MIFDFSQTLEEHYLNFAKDRYEHDDYIDAFYFKTKANKIKNYKIISPANPYSFGILPDDMPQFVLSREQLKNVSINSIINSNDGIVLADSYIAFDCWLVIAAAMTVGLNRLPTLFCTISTGLKPPCSEPTTGLRSA